MKRKTFIDQFAGMGWKLQAEDNQSGRIIYVLKNEDGFEMLINLHENRKSFSTYSEVIIPKTVEDVPIVQELMEPFLDKNKDCFWPQDADDVLCIERCYEVEVELPESPVDGRSLRRVVNRHMKLHQLAEEKMREAVEQIPAYLGPEYANLTPENWIRIPLGGLHSPFPSLRAANAYFGEYLAKRDMGDAERSIKLLTDYLPSIVLNNLCYRNYFREYGAEAMAEKLVEDLPELGIERARKGMDNLVKYHLQDGKMNELDIRYIGRRETVEIMGKTFHGIEDIRREGGKSVPTRTLVIQYQWQATGEAVGEESTMTWFAESEDQLPTVEEMKAAYDVFANQVVEQWMPQTLPMVYETDDEPVVYLFTSRKK